MSENKNQQCCDTKDCCTTNKCNCKNCGCVDCKCTNKDCTNKEGVQCQSYSHTKTHYYQNIGGKQKQESEDVVSRRTNENMQEEITREKKLENGKVLVTTQVIEDGKVKKIDQYIRGPEGQKQLVGEQKQGITQ